jgi:membrane protein DedA with SNARE-associated domain
VSGPPEKVSFLFRAAAVLAAIFCITIFAMVAAMLGDEASPPVRFLNNHGGTLIAVEVAATLLVAVIAMGADRIKTLRNLREQEVDDRESNVQ